MLKSSIFIDFSISSLRDLISILEDFSIISNAHLSVKNRFSISFSLKSCCSVSSAFRESIHSKVSFFTKLSAFLLSIQNLLDISIASCSSNSFLFNFFVFISFFSIFIIFYY
ncbi:hypothetical protein HOG21_08625 [bacterium]|nr:hypothetical protein [bacterium]